MDIRIDYFGKFIKLDLDYYRIKNEDFQSMLPAHKFIIEQLAFEIPGSQTKMALVDNKDELEMLFLNNPKEVLEAFNFKKKEQSDDLQSKVS